MSDDTVRARVTAATDELAERARARSQLQVTAIEDALGEVNEGGLLDSAREMAQRHAHQIAGSAGMFGHHDATRIARELDGLLEAPLTALSEVEHARDLTRQLGSALDQAPDVEPSKADVVDPQAPRAPRVLVATHTGDLADLLVRQARARGLDPVVLSAEDQTDHTDDPTGPQPAAAVVQVVHGRVEHDAELVARIEQRRVPVVVLLPDDADASTRLAVVRAGAHLLLDPPFEGAGAVAQVVDALGTLVAARSSQDHILAVDDDPVVLEVVRDLLTRELGARVTTLTSPDQFWSELKRLEPDLVLLDVDMPRISGLELCRAIRSDPRWRQLPVVVLSGKVDASSLEQVYGVGVDDFVVKPVLGPELRTRIGNRLERTRLHRLLAETDPLTGLANRRRMETDYRRLQQLADRFGTGLSLTVLDLDRFKRVNDRYGHAVGDGVLRVFGRHLRDSFRGEDVVARLGGEEFVVGMLGMRKGEARERVSSVLTQLASRDQVVEGHPLRVRASAGVAQYGLDGDDFNALYRAADRALRRAKELGRGRVLTAGADPAPGTREVDIVIVEDDPVRAELLRHALTAAGYRCLVRPSATRGVDPSATGETGSTPPVLLVSDLERGERDAFAVVRTLVNATSLDRHRVLLLTSDAHLAEEATRLGATVELATPLRVDAVLDRLQELVRSPSLAAAR